VDGLYEALVASVDDVSNDGMIGDEEAREVSFLPGLGLRLVPPFSRLREAANVEEFTSAYEIGEEVAVPARPDRLECVAGRTTESVAACQSAPDDLAGEPRSVRPGNRAAYDGVDPVGTDQSVTRCTHTLLRLDRYAIGLLRDGRHALTEVDSDGRASKRRVHQYPSEVAAMQIVCSRAEGTGEMPRVSPR